MWIFECETKRSIFMRFRLMLIPIIVCRIWPNMLKSRRKWSNGNRERERTNQRERLVDRIIFFSFLNDHRLLEQIKISSIDDDDDDKLNEVDLFERSLLCYEIAVSHSSLRGIGQRNELNRRNFFQLIRIRHYLDSIDRQLHPAAVYIFVWCGASLSMFRKKLLICSHQWEDILRYPMK